MKIKIILPFIFLSSFCLTVQGQQQGLCIKGKVRIVDSNPDYVVKVRIDVAENAFDIQKYPKKHYECGEVYFVNTKTKQKGVTDIFLVGAMATRYDYEVVVWNFDNLKESVKKKWGEQLHTVLPTHLRTDLYYYEPLEEEKTETEEEETTIVETTPSKPQCKLQGDIVIVDKGQDIIVRVTASDCDTRLKTSQYCNDECGLVKFINSYSLWCTKVKFVGDNGHDYDYTICWGDIEHLNSKYLDKIKEQIYETSSWDFIRNKGLKKK